MTLRKLIIILIIYGFFVITTHFLAQSILFADESYILPYPEQYQPSNVPMNCDEIPEGTEEEKICLDAIYMYNAIQLFNDAVRYNDHLTNIDYNTEKDI